MLKEIALRNISFYAFLGCLESEQDRKSLVECDVRLQVNLKFSENMAHDDLSNTLDYRVIEETLMRLIEVRHYNMMESLGEAFLREIVVTWPQVLWGSIALRKPNALSSGAVPQVTMVYPDAP